MSTRVVSKMTSKNQITVPSAVRRALYLENGESLVFAIGDDGVVTVSKAVSLDVPFAEALGPLLAEWDSDEDDEAYLGL